MTPDKTEAQPEALRVRKYIDRRSSSRGLDREHIHGFDAGDKSEALLLTSDLEALLGRIASLEAQLSARQAAPNPWQRAIDHELVCLHLGVAEDATQESAAKALRELIQCHVEIAINPQTNGGLSLQPQSAPPPPMREPLTEQEILEAVSSLYVHPALRSMGAADDIATARAIERAHGIGATNDKL